MCGICGVWNKTGENVDRNALLRMNDMLQCRGPDGAGTEVDGSAGLGHRRLSILDLSDRGRQPMVDTESGSMITYNGEVYNCNELRKELQNRGERFRSATDTEVVLKAYRIWGERCVEKFNGMFAFAIWDKPRHRLYLARDRLGIKPLYYHLHESFVVFSSRLLPLLCDSRVEKEVDREALALFFEMGYVPSPWAMIKNVKKLEQGHYLIIEENRERNECYWDLNKTPSYLQKTSPQEQVEILGSLILDSVKRRMLSDVPLGCFLSGGIDSSTTTAAMAALSSKPIQTFCVGYQETAYDESKYARQIAKLLNTEHHEMIMESKTLIGLLEQYVNYYDEPFGDYSSLPTMIVSRFAREKVTVCLSGDGGDELFAGYPPYHRMMWIKWVYRLPESVRIQVARVLKRTGKHQLTLLGYALEQNSMAGAFTFMRSMGKDITTHLVQQKSPISIFGLFEHEMKKYGSNNIIDSICAIDIKNYLCDDILQKVDCASMGFGLEARVPLLDHTIVEFARALPLNLKWKDGVDKWILRKVLSRYVPEKLFRRPKHGFSVPLQHWFRNELRTMVMDELSAKRLKGNAYVHTKEVGRIVDAHMQGTRNTHPAIWMLINFFRWEERMKRV